jgi:hypothetical protein
MAIRFVATGVLESEDGISFNIDTPLETQEEIEKRRQRETSDARPLYQQLEEQKAKKLEEEEAKRRAIFAPPKGLDEDDIEYFKEVEAQKEKMKGTRAANEEKLLENFRNKQKGAIINDMSASSTTSIATIKIAPKENKLKEITIPIVSAKRKANSSNDAVSLTKRATTINDIPTTIINDVKNNDHKTTETNNTNAISLVCDYASDDD